MMKTNVPSLLLLSIVALVAIGGSGLVLDRPNVDKNMINGVSEGDNSVCAVYGDDYHYIRHKPVIELIKGGKVNCKKCKDGKDITQIECDGNVCNSNIGKASCVLNDGNRFTCIFMGSDSSKISVATYDFRYESASKDCVLNGSEHVKYNTDHKARRLYIIIVSSCVAVVLFCCCCCCCC